MENILKIKDLLNLLSIIFYVIAILVSIIGLLINNLSSNSEKNNSLKMLCINSCIFFFGGMILNILAKIVAILAEAGC